jgi:hypothetical protein
MKKNFLVIIFALTMAVNAYAQQYDDEKDFKIIVSPDGEAIITQYLGSKRVVRIPPRIQNHPVTGIGEFAFAACASITSVTIPNSVIYIGNLAFRNCTSLTSVTIPNSVTSIGQNAFRDCTSLTSVTFQGTISSNNLGSPLLPPMPPMPMPPPPPGSSSLYPFVSPFIGDLREKYLAGGRGTYTTTAPVSYDSVWRKQ